MPSRRPLSFDPVAEAHRQWVAHGWPAADAMAAATSIMRVQQIVLASVDGALRPFGLTFARYEALVLLYFSRHGILPLGKMGERLMVHPTSVTNAIDRLARDGLVTRQPHPTDRRTVLAEITEAGRSVVEQASVAVTSAQFGVGSLPNAQLGEITEVLSRLRSGIGDFDRAPSK